MSALEEIMTKGQIATALIIIAFAVVYYVFGRQEKAPKHKK